VSPSDPPEEADALFTAKELSVAFSKDRSGTIPP